MTERISNHNLRNHEGAPLKNGVQVDVMGANGATFERPPTRADILRSNVGKAAANSFAMRQAELRDAQLQVLKQEEESYPDPVAKEDIIQTNYDLAR